MPARQGFQFDPMAAKAQIGYGEAQVMKQGASEVIDADAKRRQLELAEAQEKRKVAKEKEDKLKAPLIHGYKIMPSLQGAGERLTNDFYTWYQENGATASDAEKKRKETELRARLQGIATLSATAADKVKAYDKAKLSIGEDEFRAITDGNFTEEAFDEEGNFILDLGQMSSVVDRFGQVDSVDLTERIGRLQTSAKYNQKEGKYEIDDPDNPGFTKLISTEEVDETLADELLRNDFKNSDAVARFNMQWQYDRLSPEEKKKYGGLEDYWARQENKDELIRKIKKSELQAKPKEGKGGSGWDSDKYLFTYAEGDKEDEKTELRPIAEKEEETAVEGGKYHPRKKARDKVEFEEIRIERSDPSENKAIGITNPNDPKKQKMPARPLAVRRKKGDKDWTLLIAKQVKDIKGNIAWENTEIPYTDLVRKDVAANYGYFDADEWMEKKGKKPQSTTASYPSIGDVRNGYIYKGGDPSNKNSWEKV